MNTQERNREALIRHIADLDAVIRRRNEQIENQAHNARETQRALEEIARERDEARARAVAAESRPLTPDAITDEMVDRARDYMSINTGQTHTHKAIRGVLTAALTEPPKRPEGAEDIEVLLYDVGIDERRGEVADYIAARLTDPTRKEA